MQPRKLSALELRPFNLQYFQFGGARLQILNASGTAATDVVNPMFEDQDRSSAGYTVAATINGGFAFVWNDSRRASDSFTGTQPPYLGNSTLNSNAGFDVRVRFFDGNAVATGPSTVPDDDVETINGATMSRRTYDQYIADSTTLAGGQTAFVFMEPLITGNVDPAVGVQVIAALAMRAAGEGCAPSAAERARNIGCEILPVARCSIQ